ncbi:OmpA family protein [uncultured Desulfobulbus sp.]|uniref:OmpA family protein n=1 Tax=uncultured Desulfobulbus sp. TaxID=239745 RepID=UPI0029C801BE|nr:OmpA family protein [uncultured Desulfobulbus sp.]
MKRVVVTAALVAAMFGGSSAWSADAEKCKDHPLFTRMANFEIHGCATTEFDAVGFPKPELKEWNNPEDYSTIEGRIRAISYKLKEGATQVSSLQIIRNFQNAVKKDGGAVLGDYGPEVYPILPRTAEKFLAESPSGTSFDRYTIMTLNKGGSEFWIYLCASESYQDYMLLMVEKQEMKQEISVNELEKQINKDGFLTFYINFDTGKAILKPESIGSVDQIAALLKASPSLKVSIEGHTDNVGTPESNKKLSEERAKAVMDAVVTKGIAADRMSAVGRGQDAPVADNRKEEGRALNRRVEMVKK